MKTYWDYTEKERSEMSESEVSSMLDVELMSKGVLKVASPIIREIASVDTQFVIYFDCGGVIFKDIEQAEQFLKLNPMRENYDYNVGYDYKYAKPVEAEIKQVRLFNLSDLTNLKSILIKNNESRKHNETVREEYDKAIKKVNEVTNGVWEDWYSQKKTLEYHKKLKDTEAEYLNLTGGDAALALVFLNKVYSQSEIDEANAWFESKVDV